MKTITKYQCEICNQQFNTFAEAINCEERGIPKKYPKGMIFGQSYCGSKMVFCIVKSIVREHYIEYLTWACRDTNVGDNFGSITNCCGFDSYSTDIEPPNKKSKAYKRMRSGLRKKGIKPVDYRKGII